MKKLLQVLTLLLVFLPSLALATPEQVDFLLSGMTNTNGQALSGGKVYTYTAGTLSNKTTWSDIGESSSLPNPIILDTYGRKQVFADGLYKFIVKDSNDVTLYTLDNLYYGGQTNTLLDGGTSSGGANIYNITVAPSPIAYVTGQKFTFLSHQANTGAATLNMNFIGSKAIVTKTNQALVGGEIPNGSVVEVYYDGTSMRLLMTSPLTQLSQSQYSSALDSISGGATTLTGMTATVKIKTGDYVKISWWGSIQTNNTATECDIQVYENGVAIASTLRHFVTTGDVGSTGDSDHYGGVFINNAPATGTVTYTLKGSRTVGANVCYYHYKGLTVEVIAP